MIVRRIGRRLRRTGHRFIGWWTLLRLTGIVLLLLAILVGILGYLNQHGCVYLRETPRRILEYLSANFSMELVSIAITILFVDELYQRRETEREKRRLILQMGSPDNAFAVEAVRALRVYGWLQNGSLKTADVHMANLKKAYLVNANLQGAYLVDANLQEAKLTAANLQGADLRLANIQGARLWATDLQGTDLERADLRGADLRGALLQGGNLRHAELQGAKLMEARYNNATTWPEGFTPPALAVNVDAETNIED